MLRVMFWWLCVGVILTLKLKFGCCGGNLVTSKGKERNSNSKRIEVAVTLT